MYNIFVLNCVMTKYKGKNIRVTEDAHKLATDHCGKKIIMGAWVSDAIIEKIDREKIQDNVVLQRYGKNIETKA